MNRANVEEVDTSVGCILDKLRELKLDQKTLVIFTSDIWCSTTERLDEPNDWIRLAIKQISGYNCPTRVRRLCRTTSK